MAMPLIQPSSAPAKLEPGAPRAVNADARWLFDALSASPMRRDIKIGRATHLMHLEENRFALYRETEAFLGGDIPYVQDGLW